jgi:hypothetical protein
MSTPQIDLLPLLLRDVAATRSVGLERHDVSQIRTGVVLLSE